MTTLENALAALEIANKRIDELEKYNLDLASESFNKSNMIDYERGKSAELAAQIESLQNERDSVLQEAKIHSAELDTQKSIVTDLCGLFNLRVHDYHCLEKVRQCLLEVKAEAGRDGYKQGVNDLRHAQSFGSRFNSDDGADRYANKIREGKS